MQKFIAIESLRGWAAWWVVIGHAINLTGAKPLLPTSLGYWLGQGDLAVQLFMIVSGFVITHLLIVKQEPYAPYIGRRFFRLMPLFLVLLVAAVATRSLYEITYATNELAHGADYKAQRLLAEENYWFPHLLLHLTLLHGLVPDTVLPFSSSTFLAPAWSLSLEWQFYLIAPVLVAGMRSPRAAWLVVLLLAASAVAMYGYQDAWRYQSFLPLALPFFFGGIASRLLLEGKIPFFAIGMTIVASMIYIHSQYLTIIWKMLPIAVIWAVFLLITAREMGTVRFQSKWFDRFSWLVALNPALAALGRVSYSTYLCHIPVFVIVVGSSIALTGRSDQNFLIVMTAIAAVIAGALSFPLYRYVEQPGIRLGSRWIKRRPVDRLAAA